jgi:hypothetical protein
MHDVLIAGFSTRRQRGSSPAQIARRERLGRVPIASYVRVFVPLAPRELNANTAVT